MKRAFLALLVCAAPAFAECPPPPDNTDAMDRLIDAANAAGSETEGRAITQEMWSLWFDAPDEQAQELLDKGVAMGRVANYAGAIETLNRLVDYCDAYAEGYNQRAFMYFLSGRFTEAERDLRAALERDPRHTGVLTGLVHTLRALDRSDEATPFLDRAMEVNPWIPERRLLDELKGQPL